MAYVNDNLISGETVIKSAHIHWFIFVKGIVFFVISIPLSANPGTVYLGVFLFVISLFTILDATIKKFTTELALTNKRIIAKFGLVSRQTTELNLNRVEGLNVNQGILARVFNFGDVVISGTGGKKSPIKYIAEPLAFRRAVNEQIET